MFSPTQPNPTAVGLWQANKSAERRVFLLWHRRARATHAATELPGAAGRRQQLGRDKLPPKARITVCCAWLLFHCATEKVKA